MENNIKNDFNSMVALGLGYGTYRATSHLGKNVRDKLSQLEFNHQNTMSEITKKQIIDACYEVFRNKENTNLTLVNLEKLNSEVFVKGKIKHFEKFLDSEIKRTKNPIKKVFLKLNKSADLKNFQTSLQQRIDGRNAQYGYLPKNPFIEINISKFPNAFFHEFGHHMDYTNKKLQPFIVKTYISARTLRFLLPAILLTSLLAPSKKNNNKKENILTKPMTFVKNNVGKISCLILLPSLLKEFSANIHGVNVAKKVLDPSLLKHIKLCNAISAINYTIRFLTVSGGMCLANKVKDKFLEKHN